MDALASLLRKRLVAADDVRAVFSEIEPPFEGYRRTLEVLRSYIKAGAARPLARIARTRYSTIVPIAQEAG